MNYKQAVDWINSFQKHGIRLGLERIKIICEKLGNPQESYKIIHVGGTNGKGSVCRFISSILTESGYKTGLYLSPHLERFSERFIIKNKEITEKDIIKLVKKIKPIVEEMIDSPTYFEIVTAIAFLYFREKKVDIAVIEVGLGGRFDATNIVKPILSIITNVSLEHQDVLGKNIKDITFEKAGIIKENVPVITASTDEALKIIKQISNKKKSEIRVVERNHWTRTKLLEFKIKGKLKNYNIKTSLHGEIQGENIAISIYAIESLQLLGIFIDDISINAGIENVTNPGRFEIVKNNPLIILDGAHNIQGMMSLYNCLKSDFNYDKLILVIGILKDKNIKEMLKIILPLSDKIIITKSKNIRACKTDRLKDIIYEINTSKEIIIKNKIKGALDYAFKISDKNDLICITGSLFTVGEARAFIK